METRSSLTQRDVITENKEALRITRLKIIMMIIIRIHVKLIIMQQVKPTNPFF